MLTVYNVFIKEIIIETCDYYRTYKAAKLHFTQAKFDLFKNRVKIAGEYEFENQTDAYLMKAISPMFSGRQDAAKTCIANFSNCNYWLNHDRKQIIRRRLVWDAYRKQPEKAFTHDLEVLRNSTDKSIIDFITPTKSGCHPPIIQLWMNENVSADFLCTVDKSYPFIDNYNEFWFRESNAKIRLTKNRNFVKLDEVTISEIIHTVFNQGVLY